MEMLTLHSARTTQPRTITGSPHTTNPNTQTNLTDSPKRLTVSDKVSGLGWRSAHQTCHLRSHIEQPRLGNENL